MAYSLPVAAHSKDHYLRITTAGTPPAVLYVQHRRSVQPYEQMQSQHEAKVRCGEVEGWGMGVMVWGMGVACGWGLMAGDLGLWLVDGTSS